MKLYRPFFVCIILCAGISAIAQEKDQHKDMQMPPMGAPAEIRELKWLIGNWDVEMKSRWNPQDTNWTTEKATAKFAYILDSAVISMDFTGNMMGMPFAGHMLQTYDRETKMWQNIWVDNMSARMSMATGKKEGGKTVMLGEDIQQGQKMVTRMTTFNETPKRFEWSMEGSTDGGKTFYTWATAVYTKK